jgi:multidrug resistance efflux pump
VRLMGEAESLTGRVDSIAGGIEDRDRTEGANLLASVNPTFSWVRLAQRVPVRVTLDSPAEARELVAGRTAMVSVQSGESPQRQRLMQTFRRWQAALGLGPDREG